MKTQTRYPVTPLSLVFIFLSYLISTTAGAQGDEAIWERFSAFDPESEAKINHLPLSEVLNETIFPVGNSKRKLGVKGKTSYQTGSRIVTSPTGNPSRYEGNRLMIHAFSEEHEAFFEAYQEGLEKLSLRRALSTLNKNEQLAYWLNFYNVIVINKLIDEYPVKKLKSWRVSKRGNTFWNEKVTTVEGVPLSLRDIELILFNNWNDPLVMYGLFQGSIGGPSLPTEAFTNENVWTLLKDNAEEFVNSNRGVRTKGAKAEVSLMYKWAAPLFGSDTRVLSHIQEYENPGFHGDLSTVSSIKYKTYNWVIADIMGGTLHKGQHNQPTNLLAAQSGLPPQKGTVFGSSQTGEGMFSGRITGFNEMLNMYLRTRSTVGIDLPPQAIELMEQIMLNNNVPFAIPKVTVTDCGIEGGCVEVPVSNGPAENAGPDSQPNEGGPAWMVLPLGSD